LESIALNEQRKKDIIMKRQNPGQDSVDLRRVVVFIANFQDESVSCVTDTINSLFWKDRFSGKNT
jgi:hypothetical protein